MTRAFRFAIDHYLFLPVGAAVALSWANNWPASYFTFAHRVSFMVNDVGMALFFALMTREVVEAAAPDGALHTWRRLMLAVAAASGGCLGAVLVYLGYLQMGDESSVLAPGWPIVCATDVAFTYFVASNICSQRVIPFLVLTAIVSNAIGLVVLELRYPIGEIHAGAGIALSMVAITAAVVMRRCDVRSFWPYVLVSGAISWFGLFLTGLHPALALVPIVPFLPRTSRTRRFMVDAPLGARDALSRFHRTWKYPGHLVLFMFGLTNAGVVLRGVGTGTWAIAIAALAGKPAGTLLALAFAVAAGLRLPRHVTWRDMIVVALVSSTGFTFALFFATVAFPVGPVLNEAKLGALLTIGVSVLATAVAKLLRAGRFAERAVRRRASAPEYVGV
ncbi:MAG: hypothetical protein AUH43_20385 [Acidobacteria bacterium 13_1_40CM_65_14]|nr:MAG: hypothetical protein AUH43_20385 [Acidobacteria bacterium 13_1_40CM_65_14]OLC82780.1 MAG: hypothetical protein AUH72_05845 [Acidobacteria bacterium 13_1_40CM_4_65_8]